MLEVLRPSASLILVSLLGDFIYSHGFTSHIHSDDSQFLSPVSISPLKSRLVSQLSQRYLTISKPGAELIVFSSRCGPCPGSLSEWHQVCLVAQAEAKDLFSPITILFIVKSYKFHPPKSLSNLSVSLHLHCYHPSPSHHDLFSKWLQYTHWLSTCWFTGLPT